MSVCFGAVIFHQDLTAKNNLLVRLCFLEDFCLLGFGEDTSAGPGSPCLPCGGPFFPTRFCETVLLMSNSWPVEVSLAPGRSNAEEPVGWPLGPYLLFVRETSLALLATCWVAFLLFPSSRPPM